MMHIRIIFLSSILSLISSLSLLANNLNDQTLASWQTTYLNKMSPEQLQFTANFLYLSYAVSLLESKVRQFSVPIARLNQSVRKNIAEYRTTTEDLAMLKTLVERLAYVVGARTIHISALNTCVKHLNDSRGGHLIDNAHTRIIDAALESIQLDAQAKLCSWADTKKNETCKLLKKSSDNITASLEHFQGASRLHKGLSEGLIPITVPKEHENHQQLFILNIILSNNPELLAVAEDVTNTLNETYEHAEQLITAGAEIYKQYYATIHAMITLPTSNKHYATTMFGMHDKLPEEYKSLLPHPNQVFEHTLQTTKLYTQTELLQQ